MHLLDCVVQAYDWGSDRAIAGLLGRPPSGKPEAELWMGAHPVAPSTVHDTGASLIDAIAADPGVMLGAARHGDRLPYLFKILAAGKPLSLQAHPSKAQAEQGFAREEAAHIPRTAAHRNYKDDNHKPEILCALGEFHALCGFRPLHKTRELFAALGLGELLAAEGAPADVLRQTFASLMTAGPAATAPLLRRAESACKLHRGPFEAECAWMLRLAAQYPGDVGALTALLLNLLEFGRDEAIYLPAGNLHAYLQGTGVEVMAASDNVLRGGLTPKHVDVQELLAVLDFTPMEATVQRPRVDGCENVYDTAAPEFRLSFMDLRHEPVRPPRRGPEILLQLEGDGALKSSAQELSLPRGSVVFVPASDGEYVASGQGRLYRVTPQS
jgi:mannose-6-phosphate isomerase